MNPAPVVDTPSGTIRGTVSPVPEGIRTLRHDRIAAFKGIRYGEAPVGERRFRPPVPVAAWDGTYDATLYGPRSVQPTSMLAPAGELEGEDCLVLNVWSPDLDASLPVMVWIHGGSFTTGSSSLSFYDGSRLAARGAVVVSVNYRLGALGFLALGALDPDAADSANLGLQDQALALAWVQQHIASFGGDPERVTVFGESAGAMSASLHLVLPQSSGRFRRIIAQSGAVGHVQSASSGEAVAARTLELLGHNPAAGTVDFESLARVPAEQLREVVAAVSSEAAGDVPLPYCPTVDGTILPDWPLELLRRGAGADIPLLSGTNADEMNLFRLQSLLAGEPGDLDDDRLARRMAWMIDYWQAGVSVDDAIARYRGRFPHLGNAELWSAIGTDTTFRAHMFAMLDTHSHRGAPAWSYHFTHPSHAFDGALGASHAMEIPFVFDNLHQPGVEFLLGPLDDDRVGFAADLADTWVQFASADDLTTEFTLPGSNESWRPYESGSRTQAVLDLAIEQVDHLDGDLISIWVDGTAQQCGEATS